MEKTEIRDTIKVLLAQEPAHKTFAEIGQLARQFQEIYEEEQAYIEEVERDPTLEVVVEPEEVALDNEIKELIQKYGDKKKAFREAQVAKEANSLTIKKELLKQLKLLSEQEGSIGQAYKRIAEIRDQWKATGPVPSEKREELQNEYARLNDEFYYNIRIYKELKELDLKKNYTLKEEIIQKLKKLLEEKSILMVEEGVEKLQHEWTEIGPTFQERWPALRQSYWDAVRAVLDKIRKYYADRRQQQDENAKIKEGLINEAKVIEQTEIDNFKSWQKQAALMKELQNRWKSVGPTKRSKNETLWKSFREVCNTFFAKKKSFMQGLRVEESDAAEKKQELITKAKTLSASENWEETTQEFQRLQQAWKKIGHAGRGAEQKLWKEFQAVCNAFFDARGKHREQAHTEGLKNLEQKKALVAEIKALKQVENVEAIEHLVVKYNEAGEVPNSEVGNINKSFEEVIYPLYDELTLDEAKRERLKFKLRIQLLRQGANGEQRIQNEKKKLRQRLNNLTTDISNYEQNMSYFSGAAAAALLKESTAKVEQLKAEAKRVEDMIRMIPK